MKSIMFAGAAMMALTGGATSVAIAQDTPATTTQTPAEGTQAEPAMPATPATPATPADPQTGTSAMPATPATPATGADPNAGQPTGSVPTDSGMQPAPAGVPQDPAAPVGSSANPVTMGGNMTPPPTEAKDYPLCSRTVQDSCINPGEAKGRKRARR